MDVRREETHAGLHRANGVLNWRGVPENYPVHKHLHRFHKVLADLDRCFHDASREQIDALHDANDCVSRSMVELLRKKSTDDLLVHETEILEALLDATERHISAWSALRAKIESCYAILKPRTRGPARGETSHRATKRKRSKSRARSAIG